MDLKSLRFTINTSSLGHKIGIIKVARPEALNALNKQVMHELDLVARELEMKHELRAVVLTGEGEKSFVAGADIKEFEHLTPSQARELSHTGQAIFQRLEDLPFPVIGALNGFALGGGLELALACDFLLASSKCRWGLPEVTLGLIPGYGGTQRLPRAIGPMLAKRVALSGEMFSAQQGYEWGLFAQVLEPDQLMPAALKLAETLASRAPRALAWVKESVRTGGSLADGLRHEAELFGRTFETKDHNEGIAAFLAKRAPDFQGH